MRGTRSPIITLCCLLAASLHCNIHSWTWHSCHLLTFCFLPHWHVDRCVSSAIPCSDCVSSLLLVLITTGTLVLYHVRNKLCLPAPCLCKCLTPLISSHCNAVQPPSGPVILSPLFYPRQCFVNTASPSFTCSNVRYHFVFCHVSTFLSI